MYKYVLVGGSALTLHLCHRKSEDLDFFSYGDDFDLTEILAYIDGFQQKEIINQSEEQLDLLINGVKVTFFNESWSFLQPETVERFNLATMEQIAAMKVNTLFLRAKFRDYYDLYMMVKNAMSLERVFDVSRNIVAGVTFKLFAVALVYIDDIEDDDISILEPVETISKQEIRDFFERLLST